MCGRAKAWQGWRGERLLQGEQVWLPACPPPLGWEWHALTSAKQPGDEPHAPYSVTHDEQIPACNAPPRLSAWLTCLCGLHPHQACSISHQLAAVLGLLPCSESTGARGQEPALSPMHAARCCPSYWDRPAPHAQRATFPRSSVLPASQPQVHRSPLGRLPLLPCRSPWVGQQEEYCRADVLQENLSSQHVWWGADGLGKAEGDPAKASWCSQLGPAGMQNWLLREELLIHPHCTQIPQQLRLRPQASRCQCPERQEGSRVSPATGVKASSGPRSPSAALGGSMYMAKGGRAPMGPGRSPAVSSDSPAHG